MQHVFSTGRHTGHSNQRELRKGGAVPIVFVPTVGSKDDRKEIKVQMDRIVKAIGGKREPHAARESVSGRLHWIMVENLFGPLRISEIYVRTDAIRLGKGRVRL